MDSKIDLPKVNLDDIDPVMVSVYLTLIIPLIITLIYAF